MLTSHYPGAVRQMSPSFSFPSINWSYHLHCYPSILLLLWFFSNSPFLHHSLLPSLPLTLSPSLFLSPSFYVSLPPTPSCYWLLFFISHLGMIKAGSVSCACGRCFSLFPACGVARVSTGFCCPFPESFPYSLTLSHGCETLVHLSLFHPS